MKIKLLLSVFLTLAFGAVAFSQSVTVTSKKVTYRRPKPESTYKKTFTIQYLLQYHYFTGNKEALQQALLSIDKMLMGGIYDHVGGGLARYSTDNEWFELGPIKEIITVGLKAENDMRKTVIVLKGHSTIVDREVTKI